MLPLDRKLTSSMTLVMTLLLWLLVFNYAKTKQLGGFIISCRCIISLFHLSVLE